MQHLANPPALYNVGTGKGVSVREFVDACRKVTGQDIVVIEQQEARPGDYAEVCYVRCCLASCTQACMVPWPAGI
jgi:UDP-arabinose 4-epimerase